MTSRVCSKNKEKKAKRKNSVKKKKRPNRENKRYKETESSVAGSRTGFICTYKKLLDHCTTVTHKISKINFFHIKTIFLCHRRCLELVELYLSLIQIYMHLSKNSLSAYFTAILHYFVFNGPTRCRQSIELALLNLVEN